MNRYYVALDVHQASICIAVLNAEGKSAKVIVCGPRQNHLLQDGNKSDKVDARKMAQLLDARHRPYRTVDLKRRDATSLS